MIRLTISLPEQMHDYVRERLRDGQYGNTSEYFRDLVRREQAGRTGDGEGPDSDNLGSPVRRADVVTNGGWRR